MNTSAHDFWLTAWQQVIRANNDKKHDFRTAVISTVTEQRLPNARTVVMRKADSDNYELWLYTDCRSAKFSELELQRSKADIKEQRSGSTPSTPQLHWLFWSPRENLQLGTGGPMRLLSESATDNLFKQLPKYGRKTYATTLPPGFEQTTVTDGLPKNWNKLKLADTDYARTNFRVIITTLQYADILHLNRSGNRRAKAVRLEDGNWEANWVVP